MIKKVLVALLALGIIIPSVNAIFDPLEFHNNVGKYGMYKIDTQILGTDIVDVELIENTDECLIDCYAIIRIHPYQELTTNSDSKTWSWQFNTLKYKNVYLDYKIEVKEVEKRYISSSVCTKYKDNKSAECLYSKEIITEAFVENWKEIDYYKYSFPVGKDTYIKISAERPFSSNIDWIPTFYGYKLDAWAWWNNSYSNRRNITANPSEGLMYPINGTVGSDIDSSGTAEQYYGYSGTGDFGLYYDNENSTALANATDEFYMVQTIPIVRTQGSAPADLLLYMPFDNSNTYVWDFSGNGNNGTRTAGLRIGIDGQFGKGLGFNGTAGNYVNVSATAGNWKAISIWFYNNMTINKNSDGALVYDYNGGRHDQIMFGSITSYAVDETVTVRARGIHAYTYIKDNISVGWHHIVFNLNTSANNSYEIYIDNDHKTEYTYAGGGGYLGNLTDWSIGDRNIYGDNPFNGTIDEYTIYNKVLSESEIEYLYNASLNQYMMLDTNESIGGITITLDNVSESIYEASNLNPNLTVTSQLDFDVFLYMENTNGSHYEVFNVSETAGTYTNSSITVDTTNYLDGLYYLHAVANNTGSTLESDNSSNFTIRNLHIWDIGNMTCSGNFSGLEYFNLSYYSAENATARITLNQAGSSWSLYNLTYAGSGNYTNNSLLLNTSAYNTSVDYYLTVNVTDNIGNTETNNTCNFTIDTTSPEFTLYWNLNNGWYSSLNHWVKFYVTDDLSPSMACNITHNDASFNNYTANNTNYTLYANITDGLNWFNYTCNDSAGNSVSENLSINASYTQINIKKEEERTADFPIQNYAAHMFVTLSSDNNKTYELTNSTKMKNWYFYTLNDTIESVRLAIGTDYYRSQTDLQNLTNLTFYMYNNTNFSSSQILFQIDTTGYDKPLLVKRPRATTNDYITAEYPIGSNREINAFLLDSRLYNIYGYNENDSEIFISSLMVAGARTINIEIPTTYDTFITADEIYAHFTSARDGTTENYTLTASAKGSTYTIAIKNWTGSTLASGVYSGTSTLSVIVNKSLLNETNFYAEFNFTTENLQLRRSLSLGSPAMALASLGWLDIGDDGLILYGIFVLVISIGIAGIFSRLDMSLGLFIGAGILALMSWAMELPNVFITVAGIMGLLAGASLLLRMRSQ